MDKEREIRTNIYPVEVRSDDSNQKKIIGYALKWNAESENLGGFIETIDRHALDNADMEDVRGLIDHDSSKILGRTTNKTLNLQIDDIGLKFEVLPPDTSYVKDLLVNMDNKNINQCSFAFIVDGDNDGDTWEYDDKTDTYRRTILKIKRLFDVSIVTYPAYPQTEAAIAQRKLNDIKTNIQKEKDKEMLKRKIEIELELTN